MLKTLGRAFVWVLLAFLLMGLIGTAGRLLLALGMIGVLAWNGNLGAAFPDAGRWGEIIGSLVGQYAGLLVFGWLWLKTFRWLRRTAASSVLSSTPISIPGQS